MTRLTTMIMKLVPMATSGKAWKQMNWVPNATSSSWYHSLRIITPVFWKHLWEIRMNAKWTLSLRVKQILIYQQNTYTMMNIKLSWLMVFEQGQQKNGKNLGTLNHKAFKPVRLIHPQSSKRASGFLRSKLHQKIETENLLGRLWVLRFMLRSIWARSLDLGDLKVAFHQLSKLLAQQPLPAWMIT